MKSFLLAIEKQLLGQKRSLSVFWSHFHNRYEVFGLNNEVFVYDLCFRINILSATNRHNDVKMPLLLLMLQWMFFWKKGPKLLIIFPWYLVECLQKLSQQWKHVRCLLRSKSFQAQIIPFHPYENSSLQRVEWWCIETWFGYLTWRLASDSGRSWWDGKIQADTMFVILL